MEFKQIVRGKKEYLPLLLLADPEEAMIDRYLERGELFVLWDKGEVRAAAVITEESPQVCEVKNIAVRPDSQRRGYGKRLLDFLAEHYRGRFQAMLAGTGETPSSVGFYTACGFVRSHVVENFFTGHYSQPVVDEGILLRDMLYFSRSLTENHAEGENFSGLDN